MRRIMHRLFMAWQYEKEEDWLNEMAANGWNLVDTSLFRYTFEEGTPGEYQYRLELLEHGAKSPESIAYIRFMEETGAEHIATWFNGWTYFRKKVSDGPFAIFSDIDSKIKHLKRIERILLLALACELCAGGAQGVQYADTGGAWSLGVFIFAMVLAVIILLGLVRIRKQIKHWKEERDIRE
ncbi:MAG: DUF2812 domain-containing protein [Eubacteriales bacterium]|nr:DUF2812 domain-containing protein [Eubacteriales bacterium]